MNTFWKVLGLSLLEMRLALGLRTMKSPIPFEILALLGYSTWSLPSASAQDGTVFYSSDFNNLGGWTGQLNPGVGICGSIQTNDPFVIASTSMGSYMTATYYPTTLVTPAVTSTDPSVWLGFLLRGDSSSTWLGGVNVTGGTNNAQVQYSGPWIAQIGSLYNSPYGPNTVSPFNGNFSSNAPNVLQLTNGGAVAVLAHLYDNNASGSYKKDDFRLQEDINPTLSTLLRMNNLLKLHS
jgi:hypothetical protein